MLLAAAAQEIPSWFVVVMGIGTVFAGLIAIIVIITLTSKILSLLVKDKTPVPVSYQAPVPAPVKEDTIPNREEFVAAVAAAIAEDLGTDISKIQILSIKKL